MGKKQELSVPKSANIGRHETQCSICAHARREDIEAEFIAWGSTTEMATKYSVSRDAIYRHAHAMGLSPKRQRNVRVALERIIERAGEVEVNAAAVVSAVGAYARINSSGQWVERSERIDMNALFERMSKDELDRYAKTGELPAWFTSTVGATS